MIIVDSVEKRFSRNPLVDMVRRRRSVTNRVLRGVDLDVSRGESVALLGANGTGKTTLLKTVATLLLPDAGHVQVMGVDLKRSPARARANIGYVLADERSFQWRLSAAANLDFFGKLDGLPTNSRAKRIAYLLERLDLASAGDRPVGQFSTGMKQRLAVARALLKQPPVLLMDEPTRSIDPGHAAQVWELVRDEMDEIEGCLVLVTHQVQEALSLCSRVAILSEGRIVMDTSAGTLERYSADVDGFTLSVRGGLSSDDLVHLGSFAGVRDVRLASQVAGEQILEVSTRNGDQPLAAFLSEITSMGLTICSLQRATPLQGIIESLIASGTTPVPAEVA